MLDCLELCELSEEEVRAIAEHEHIPEVVALELGDYLIRGPTAGCWSATCSSMTSRPLSGAAIWSAPLS
jgi:hypothetical protein